MATERVNRAEHHTEDGKPCNGWTGGKRIEAKVNQDGTFEMRLSPSTYASMVVIPRNDKSYFVSRVKVVESNVDRSARINIPPGSGHSLEFVLSQGGARLNGVVTDDKVRR